MVQLTTEMKKKKRKENGTIMLPKEKKEHMPHFPLLKLLFTYAFCMVVSSIVLMIDGDGHGAGDSLQDLFLCFFSSRKYSGNGELNADGAAGPG